MSATQPRSVPAQFTPSASNMYVANRGNTAPKMERRKVFAAMAEAALEGSTISWDIEWEECAAGTGGLQHEVRIHEVVERL